MALQVQAHKLVTGKNCEQAERDSKQQLGAEGEFLYILYYKLLILVDSENLGIC